MNITLYSIDFDVQQDCLLIKVVYAPCYKSHNVVLLHIKLNQLKHRKTLTWSMISYNGARIKVHRLLKEVKMFN